MKGMGVASNPVEAVRCFKLTAKQGFVQVQYAYGSCLMKGEGVITKLADRRWIFRNVRG